MTERVDHFIGGAPSGPANGEYFVSTNPATLETLYEVARGGEEDVRRAVAAAKRAFESPAWAGLTPTKRGHLLRRLADLVGEHADELARLESLDNGKLLREMRGQLATLPEYLYYYGGLADKVQGAQVPTMNPAILNYTQREPLGVVGAITPWNSPLTLTTSKLAPALAAGNTVVIKPSEHTSRTVLRFAELVAEAGFPDGVVNVVTGYGGEAGAALVAHPDLAKISFTGSTATGSRIAQQAAARFIGCTLELGGKSPNIVFADANVQNAAMGVIAGIFAAAGQTCIAGSRVFAHRSVYDELVELVSRRAESIVIGDPMHDSTELGPLAFGDQLEKVESYVHLGVDEGARVRSGGARPDVGLPGYYFSPTVLTDVNNDMRVVREEIFGPVAAIMPFDTEDEVVALANDTDYGLAAGVWTQNLARAHRMARRLEAGTVWINTYRAMSPMSPRQGFKSSGVGIEHGLESMHEYTRLKSVWVNTDEGAVDDPFVMRS
ncbi:aldehyde dehydrogenase [Pseudoclavibacter endophyticus]|uniref:Aldehyde dehydrogenase n=1 Tax=Pseudoclavibacter endophyticus TaxID=1778590 RepID=A0A6H9WF43_9MICO|nr:aldehyde dehydrogenase [Pseudoclavibacter endophyticus]KAB1649559.1 aldehyde dehydrogenase [Pseudoclavibacter endophyticus]GGA61630.1 aldehyde dehydrogenase [Pseudoclavibacter endophyticus]